MIARHVAMALLAMTIAAGSTGCSSVLGYDDLSFDGQKKSAGPADGRTTTTFTSEAPSADAGANGPSPDGSPGTVMPPPPPPAPATATLAQGITVSAVALYQGVKVPLANAGAKVTTRSMPVIAGRDGRVRVYVTPDPTFTPRSLTAELHLVSGTAEVAMVSDTKMIAGPSTEIDPQSTFNLDVVGANLPPGVGYFVRLLDASAPAVPVSTVSPAQYPTDAKPESLDAIGGAEKLKVVLVPLRYGADGSNRVPDTSPAILEKLRTKTLELYPVPAVDITVHAPVDYAAPLLADGTGWPAVVSTLMQLRITENPPADVYYYGVFAPAATFSAFCSAGCVAGLSPVGDVVGDATARASVGALYDDPQALLTLPHEVGHAHGRHHAPCGGAADPDTQFPYANATIGSWGYSIVSKQFIDPGGATTPHDFMSYCDPAWTSDYTFKALFDRGVALKGASLIRRTVAVSQRRLTTLLQDASGTLRWHGAITPLTSAELGGEERAVTFLAADGHVLGTDVAHRYGFDHLADASFLLPEPPPGTARVAIAGAGTISTP